MLALATRNEQNIDTDGAYGVYRPLCYDCQIWKKKTFTHYLEPRPIGYTYATESICE